MIRTKASKRKPESKVFSDLDRIRQSRTPAAFLKKLISPYQYGWKDSEGMHQLKLETVIESYNRWGRVRLWNLSDFISHLITTVNYTIYFAGDGRKSQPYTLAMIDIDVLKARGKGTVEGGIKFVKRLREFWPDLYWESSTNGNGIHAYILVDKRRFDARQTNEALKSLQTFLRSIATGYDIEGVEVKGTCPVIQYGVWGEKRIESITFGQLAKLPRDEQRFDKWRNTTCLTVTELLSMEPIESTEDIASNTPNISFEYTRSISGVPFSRELMERYKSEDLTELAERWLGAGGFTGAKRCKVRPKDMALSMAIIVHCTVDANKDGSIPQSRAHAIWDVAHSTGIIDKKWDHNIFTAARNWLNSHGYLDVVDMGFTMKQAARWGASESLLSLVLDTQACLRTRNGGTAPTIDETQQATPRNESYKLKGRETSLGGNDQDSQRKGRETSLGGNSSEAVEHPRTPNPFAELHGFPTCQVPFYRPPATVSRRA